MLQALLAFGHVKVLIKKNMCVFFVCILALQIIFMTGLPLRYKVGMNLTR